MAFQSDIYLGWVGRERITGIMGPDFYAEDGRGNWVDRHTDLPQLRPLVLDYLRNRYGFVPSRDDRRSFRLFETLEVETDGRRLEDGDHVLGIQLTARYRPAFLDFRSAHGGLHIKTLDRTLFDDIEWLRRRVLEIEGMGRYSHAQIFVRDNWY